MIATTHHPEHHTTQTQENIMRTATKTCYLCYLCTPDRQGSLLMGAGWSHATAIADGQRAAAHDLGSEIEEGSYYSTQEAPACHGERLRDIMARCQ